MQTLPNALVLLCSSLGYGSLAGINLYLASFIVGMAIRFNFIQVHEQLHQLDVLASPWIILTSGVVFIFEFFADKIPGLDSIWDSIHTVIRPIGAMAVSLMSIGTVDDEWIVLASLLSGSASLTTHTAKMGTRLVANTSPEPVSNVVLSVGEDIAVASGAIFLLKYPIVTASFCLIGLIGLWIIIPKIIRKIGGLFKVIRFRFSRNRIPQPH
jgi:hypothetical protein